VGTFAYIYVPVVLNTLLYSCLSFFHSLFVSSIFFSYYYTFPPSYIIHTALLGCIIIPSFFFPSSTNFAPWFLGVLLLWISSDRERYGFPSAPPPFSVTSFRLRINRHRKQNARVFFIFYYFSLFLSFFPCYSRDNDDDVRCRLVPTDRSTDCLALK